MESEKPELIREFLKKSGNPWAKIYYLPEELVEPDFPFMDPKPSSRNTENSELECDQNFSS